MDLDEEKKSFQSSPPSHRKDEGLDGIGSLQFPAVWHVVEGEGGGRGRGGRGRGVKSE